MHSASRVAVAAQWRFHRCGASTAVALPPLWRFHRCDASTAVCAASCCPKALIQLVVCASQHAEDAALVGRYGDAAARGQRAAAVVAQRPRHRRRQRAQHAHRVGRVPPPKAQRAQAARRRDPRTTPTTQRRRGAAASNAARDAERVGHAPQHIEWSPDGELLFCGHYGTNAVTVVYATGDRDVVARIEDSGLGCVARPRISFPSTLRSADAGARAPVPVSGRRRTALSRQCGRQTAGTSSRSATWTCVGQVPRRGVRRVDPY